MGSTIGFFCGNDDHQALQNYAESLGLQVIAPLFDVDSAGDAVDGPFCYLSAVSKAELHPFGNPANRLTDARDPILTFMRGYFKSPYLVAGHIYWSDDVATLAAITKPYFHKLSKWIRQNWEVLPGGGGLLGPSRSRVV
jgi:hypothetical protein